jgi:hypothetical protein
MNCALCRRGNWTDEQRGLTARWDRGPSGETLLKAVQGDHSVLLEPAYANLVNVHDELNEVVATLENFEKCAPLFIR